MENYDPITELADSRQGDEGEITKSLEHYTSAIPSSAYLAVAVGAMGLSLFCQVTGRGRWGNFIAQWAPTVLIVGLYNKLVKLEGHDRTDREELGEYTCEFCESKFSVKEDLRTHQKHCRLRGSEDLRLTNPDGIG
jgi:hypothetical protein